MDMARVRACIDPPTGLRIVRCPRCGRASARRDVAGARRRRQRLAGSWCTLIRRIVVGAFFIGLFTGWVVGIAGAEEGDLRGVAAELSPGALAQKSRDEIVFLLFYAGLLAFGGLWTQTTLRHVGPAARWIVAALLGAVACSADWAVVGVRNLVTGASGARAWAGPDAVEMANRAAAFGIAAAIISVGAAAGTLLNRSADARTSARWRKRLARARRRVSAA